MFTLPALFYFCESMCSPHSPTWNGPPNHRTTLRFKLDSVQKIVVSSALGGRMANESTFDIVSEVDKQAAANAVDHAAKEIPHRYDFKDTGATIEHTDPSITLTANAA